MSVVTGFVEENLRRVSARATHGIALRYGRTLPMWLGVGYPKSGTVWLCQLMSSYLGVPYPQNYRTPVAMKSVVHAHWDYDKRLPPAVYIVRDGRDVMTSFYFFHMRTLTQPGQPETRARLQRRYTKLFGSDFEPGDIEHNFPIFVEHMMTASPVTHGVSWGEHVRQWVGEDRQDVAVVRYEDLLTDTPTHLANAMERLTGRSADLSRAQAAASLNSFAARSGRAAGDEDRESFLRKGIAGDWRNHFSREAAQVFDHYAGDMLIKLGYAADSKWSDELGHPR